MTLRRLSPLALLFVVSTLFAAPPPLPPTPAPIGALISARPFTLERGFQYDWRAERPLVTSGHLLVLAVDPDLVYPRQTAEPILYVGDQTAMRLNVAYPSGRLVALVPGDLSVSATRIWFGRPGLPEQETATSIESARREAELAGLGALPAVDVSGALERGGPALRVTDLEALLDAVGSQAGG